MEKKCNVCGRIVNVTEIKCPSCGNDEDFTAIAEFVIKIIIDKKEIATKNLEAKEIDLYDLLDGLKAKINILSLGLKDLEINLQNFVDENSILLSTDDGLVKLKKNKMDMINSIRIKDKEFETEEIVLKKNNQFTIGPITFKLKEKR